MLTKTYRFYVLIDKDIYFHQCVNTCIKSNTEKKRCSYLYRNDVGLFYFDG